MARTCRQRVSIAHLAGVVPERPVDGRSVVPLLMGMTPDNWRTRFLVEHWFEGSEVDVPTYAAVRTERYTYVEYVTGERQLYDLRSDPDQLHNIVSTVDKKVVDDLAKQAAALRTCKGVGCRRADRG